jgi:hypothetical protein
MIDATNLEPVLTRIQNIRAKKLKKKHHEHIKIKT